MWRAICSPMAPSPIIAGAFHAHHALLNSSPHLRSRSLADMRSERDRASCSRLRRSRHASAVLAPAPRRSRARRLRRDIALAHVGEHALGLARERIAVAAAARRIEAEDVARLERIIGIAGRQALGVLACPGLIQMSPVRPVLPPAQPFGGITCFDRADREARILEIEIFAADAEPAAEFARRRRNPRSARSAAAASEIRSR